MDSYSNPNFLLPGRAEMPAVDLVCAIDTSGSMTEDMIRDFLSEVHGIIATFPAFKMWLLTFDTEVYNPVLFTPMNVGELPQYEVKGGGGTMFECVWDWMKQRDLQPERLVFFTDGYPCGTWGDPDYVPTLFVIHGKTAIHQRIKAPHGMTAYYETR